MALFALAAAFWSSAALLGFGLWRRREWARLAAVAGLYLLAAMFLLLLLFPGLAVPAPLYYGGAEISPEFNAAVRSAAFRLRLASLLAGACSLWAALALDRGELRKEFIGPYLSN
jgi:hypothetical protein